MPTSRDKLFGLMISKLSKINYRRVKWSRANKLYTRLVRQIRTERQRNRRRERERSAAVYSNRPDSGRWAIEKCRSSWGDKSPNRLSH